jgi:hypothetical protein
LPDVSVDLLDGSRPKRLVRRNRRWHLEVVRFVSRGEGVFQPHTHRVEGNAAILELLGRSRHGRALLESTRHIVAREGADDESFDAVDGRWVPTSAAPSGTKQLGRHQPRTATEAALAAEVTLLRACVEGLTTRVARLEERLSRIVEEARHARSMAPPRSARGESSALQAPRAGAAPRETDRSKPTRAEVKDESVPEQRRLRPPSFTAVMATLSQLAGQPVPLKEAKEAAPAWLTDPTRFFVALLVDDQDGEVGAVLCDAEAVARIGGALLLLPRSEIDAQATTGAPSEESKMSMSEICNNLSGPVNETRGNPHVRARILTPLDGNVPDWLRVAPARLVCVHAGGGTIAIVGR